MNSVINNSVLKYFEQISNIPRNSGKEEKIKDYLVSFANQRSLPCYTDEFNNVIIFKKTADIKPIILQAHTDMVCVKNLNSKFNFDTDSIKIVREGNFLKAKGTSLGADDGIGMALILDILDSDIPCNIEAVFTSSEETTMQGAYGINVKKLKAKEMICLDGFEGNTIITSSAGFVDFYVTFSTQKQMLDNSSDLKTFSISIKGLEGGHSGFDIDKNRGSTHKLLAEILLQIPNIKLNKFSGGHNFNVIPSSSEAIFTTTLPEKQLKETISVFYKQQKQIYKNLQINCVRQLNQTLVLENSENILNFINKFSQGVVLKDKLGNIISSQNLSEINAEQGYFKIGIRSSDKKQEEKIIEDLKNLCKEFGFEHKILGVQPAFNTIENSQLFDLLMQTGKTPKEVKMHIAVECGIFQERIKNLDVVIISPTIKNAHSVEESLDIQSVIDTQNWIKNFLLNRQ